MIKTVNKDWPAIALDTWQLGFEAWIVVGLRSGKIALGGSEGCSEARLMVTEKVESGLELGKALLGGELGTTLKAVCGNTVAHYLAGVRSNRQRLLGQ